MNRRDLAQAVEAAWDERDRLTPESGGGAAEAVETALTLLDSGEARVAEKRGRRLGRQPVAQEGGAALLPP